MHKESIDWKILIAISHNQGGALQGGRSRSSLTQPYRNRPVNLWKRSGLFIHCSMALLQMFIITKSRWQTRHRSNRGHLDMTKWKPSVNTNLHFCNLVFSDPFQLVNTISLGAIWTLANPDDSPNEKHPIFTEHKPIPWLCLAND